MVTPGVTGYNLHRDEPAKLCEDLLMNSPEEQDTSTDAEIKALLLAKLQHKHDQRVSAFHRKEKRHSSLPAQPSFNRFDHQKTLEVYRQRYFQSTPVRRNKAQIWLEVILTLLEVAAIIGLAWLLGAGPPVSAGNQCHCPTKLCATNPTIHN